VSSDHLRIYQVTMEGGWKQPLIRVLRTREPGMTTEPNRSECGFVRSRLGLMLAALVLAPAVGRAADEGDDRTRVERAIAYLDARQEAWSNFARAARGEGADRTTCVSCHTVLSYALARSALGRFSNGPGHGTETAAAEARMLAAIRLRVEHWADLDTPRFDL